MIWSTESTVVARCVVSLSAFSLVSRWSTIYVKNTHNNIHMTHTKDTAGLHVGNTTTFHVNTDSRITTLMCWIQLGQNLCGIQASVLSKSAREHLKSLGECFDRILLKTLATSGMGKQLRSNSDFTSTTTASKIRRFTGLDWRLKSGYMNTQNIPHEWR